MTDKINLTESLKELETIVEWFDEQQDVDVEVGLTKVKLAATLIKSSKARLAEIENEFQEIEKEISDDSGEDGQDDNAVSAVVQQPERPVDRSEIPF